MEDVGPRREPINMSTGLKAHSTRVRSLIPVALMEPQEDARPCQLHRDFQFYLSCTAGHSYRLVAVCKVKIIAWIGKMPAPALVVLSNTGP